MGWFGKMAGAAIGFIVGGPLGAAGGAFIGHKLFDDGKTLSRHEEVQANYFVALFSMLGKMAKADGIVTADEVQVVDNIMKNSFRFNSDQREFAIKIFNESKDSSYSFDDFAKNFYQMNVNNPDMLFTMLNTLFEVAKADGKLHPNEEILLERARVIFRISNQNYENLKQRHFPRANADKHYAVLNCSATDTVQTIKSSYRKLVHDFHPDKIIDDGLPDEFKEHAKIKFQEIQDAYDYIRQERGF